MVVCEKCETKKKELTKDYIVVCLNIQMSKMSKMSKSDDECHQKSCSKEPYFLPNGTSSGRVMGAFCFRQSGCISRLCARRARCIPVTLITCDPDLIPAGSTINKAEASTADIPSPIARPSSLESSRSDNVPIALATSTSSPASTGHAAVSLCFEGVVLVLF